MRLPFLSFLMHGTGGKIDALSELDRIKVYEEGVLEKPVGFNISDSEREYILDLSNRYGGYVDGELLSKIAPQKH